METDFSVSGNHFVPISPIFLPLEAVFPPGKYLLNESFITVSGKGFPVYWKRYSFIQIFLETIIAIGARPIFKKNLISATVEETVFINFFFRC